MAASMRAGLRRFLCSRTALTAARSLTEPLNPTTSRPITNYVCLRFQSSVSAEDQLLTNTQEQNGTQSKIDPLDFPDYFGVSKLFSLKDLFEARVHLGHKAGLRENFVAPYLYGNRLGVDIFDLDITAEYLLKALNVVAHIAYRDGIILFLNRSKQHSFIVEQTAKECGEFAHTRFWSGGLFTNSTSRYKSMTRLPDCCIFISTQNSIFGMHRAVNEAAKMQILSVGVVDSNCDPRLIGYPVPGNDDSPASVKLYCDLFKQAILLGKEKRKLDAS